MGDNIISLKDARAKRMKPIAYYHVRIDLYEDGIGGEIELPDLSPDELRNVSEQLFAFARHIRDCVWEKTGDPDDRQLSVTRVYESSRVTCWTSNDIDTPERGEWLARRFEEASECSQPPFPAQGSQP